MSIILNSSNNKINIESSRSVVITAQSPSVIVGNRGLQGAKGEKGDTGGDAVDTQTTWMTLARGFSATPTLLQTVVIPSSGKVYLYTYVDGVRYRFIADDGSLDAFYETFIGSVLGVQVAKKNITLSNL
jgi:hypothetical protein